MTSLDVVLENYLWKKKIKNPQKYFKTKLIQKNKINFLKKKSKNFTILLTKNKKMKMLNKQFRKINKSTDVLSFPFNKKISLKKNEYLGDIAISYEIINKRAKYSNFIKEFDKMWIHGYLHLLGYNHRKKKEFIKMQKLENLMLNCFHK